MNNSSWIVVAVVSSFALVPICFYGCGPEWARWDAAQAMQFYDRGETKDALYQLECAVEKSPRDPVIKLLLARGLMRAGKSSEGLAVTEQVLEQYPNNRSALLAKSECQQRCGDFIGGLETYQLYEDSNKSFVSDVNSWNQLAYYRALAKKDLHLASDDIDRVVKSRSRERWACGDLSLAQKSIVAAAIISRSTGVLDSVLEELELQINATDYLVNVKRTSLIEQIYDKVQTEPTFTETMSDPIRDARYTLRSHEESLAVLLTCRALIYQDLGETGFCLNDRQHVRELEFDAQQIAALLPSEEQCLHTLVEGSIYLDTRGFVGSLLIWLDDNAKLRNMPDEQRRRYSSYTDALADLNTAVLAAETFLNSIDGPLHNRMESSFDRDEAKSQWKRHCAVMLYHRMLLHQRKGLVDLAEADRKRVVALGFEPDESLF